MFSIRSIPDRTGTIIEDIPGLASKRSVGETVQEIHDRTSATGSGSNPGLEAVDDHHERIRFSVEDVTDAAPSRFPTI
ncbi:hypothetical protein HT576_04365 [Haloterrigena sp. SYSU A121-1]|uniref:Uncharacterized protein n=1 Tax=Haloterrigena gelatinilytica TaxID=2741724 RepID=A0A8J8KGP9_9EURY|nr:hypothetical protein [Haloterrigena gelatinilytica]NUB90269.1 hypothetical protein [Haloterrigena gelatinilytica]